MKHGVHVAGAAQVVETHTQVLGTGLFSVFRQFPENWKDESIEEIRVIPIAFLVEMIDDLHNNLTSLISLAFHIVAKEFWLNRRQQQLRTNLNLLDLLLGIVEKQTLPDELLFQVL